MIGGYSFIRAEVMVGEGFVVSFYSLVNKDVKDDEIVGGIPTKSI